MKLTILKQNSILILTTCGLILASCSGLSPAPAETPTPAPTETPTSTIVWFPPTDTPTSLPTQTIAPTQEYHPSVGDLLFSDSFDQPELWDTPTSNSSSASVTRKRLVLSISGPGPLSITSLRRQTTVGDFYAEATASLSLCLGNDQYGMVFRAAGGNYYRFTVNCNGQVLLERAFSGTVYPIQNWLSSGDAPDGAPVQVRIGVWAAGNEMRFFLNGNYQFTKNDTAIHAGTIGFFVYASGKTPVTVSFSDLTVRTVSYVPPAPSLTPTRTPRP